MTLTELLKDIYDSSRERMKTPITGAYTIAFILYNWQAILYLLFSNKTIEYKLETIANDYSGWAAVVWPLLMASLYVILVPFIMTGLEKCTKWAVEARKTHMSKQILHDKKLQTEILRIEYQNEEIRSGKNDLESLNNTIAEKDSKIEILNEQIERINKGHNSSIEMFKSVQKNLEEKIELLNSNNILQTEQYDLQIKKIDFLERNYGKNLFITLSSNAHLYKIYNNLSKQEKATYIEICNNILSIDNDVVKVYGLTTLDPYIKLGLIASSKGHKLTSHGEIIYEILKYTRKYRGRFSDDDIELETSSV